MARRTRTLTIWSTTEQITLLDEAARRNGRTRAQFARDCINAGYKALKSAGKLA